MQPSYSQYGYASQTMQPQQGQTTAQKSESGDNAPKKRTNGFGIAGFVYAFFSLFLGGLTFFPGFVLSCIGLGMRKECTKSNGVAVAGLIFAIINILEVAALVYYIMFAGGLEVIENFLGGILG
ncbi:MAG: hypothetical protein LUE27_09320 [Clostridia bacterium]|nr:hypothetical protein [Clostridia bacterium]